MKKVLKRIFLKRSFIVNKTNFKNDLSETLKDFLKKGEFQESLKKLQTTIDSTSVEKEKLRQNLRTTLPRLLAKYQETLQLELNEIISGFDQKIKNKKTDLEQKELKIKNEEENIKKKSNEASQIGESEEKILQTDITKLQANIKNLEAEKKSSSNGHYKTSNRKNRPRRGME